MKITNTGETVKPPRLLIHGSHFSGKSSIGASASSPIFMDIEKGLNEIKTKAMPTPTTTDDIMSQLRWFYAGEHEFKTLVIDSLDWMETVVNHTVMQKNSNLKSLIDKYGKGYELAYKEFILIKDALEAIHRDRNACVIILCHSHIKEFKDPAGENYDRYSLKLRDKIAELSCEWSDIVGFLHPEIEFGGEEEGGGFAAKKKKAITSGRRLLSVNQNPAYRAGNRYGIKQDIVINNEGSGWSDIWSAIQDSRSKRS